MHALGGVQCMFGYDFCGDYIDLSGHCSLGCIKWRRGNLQIVESRCNHFMVVP